MPFRREQTSFVSGEIAGELSARRDTVQYPSALARARNITAIPQGGFQRRIGSAYVATLTSDSGNPEDGVLMLPFEFSKTETYLIILTADQIQVRDSDGALVKTFTNTLNDPVYASSELDDVAFVQALDTMFLAHPDHVMRVLQRFDTNDWRLTEFVWTVEDDDVGSNQPWHKYADGSTTMAASTVTLGAATWTSSAPFWQGGHIAERVRMFRRTTFEEYLECEVQSLAAVSITGTLTFTQNSTAVSASGGNFNGEVYVGDWIYLDADGQTDGSTGSLTRVAAKIASITDDDNLVLAEKYTSAGGAGASSMVKAGEVTALTGTPTITNGSAAVTGSGTAFLTEVNIGDRIYETADGQVFATKVSAIASDTALTLDRVYDGTGGSAGGSVTDKRGLLVATVDNRIKIGSPGNSARTSWKEAALSGARGYTRTVALHQNRLVIGGTRDLPDTCFFTKTGLFFVYDEGTALADESFSLTMTSNQINEIQAILSQTDLLIGTLSASFSERSVPITPDAAGVQVGPTVGWANVTPVGLEGAVVYVSDSRGSSRQRIVELAFDDSIQAYVTTDISLLAFHLINQPVRMGISNGNDQTTADNVFVVNRGANADEDIDGAGSMAVLNTIRSQQITGWSLWVTDGEYLDATVIGNVAWVVVKRTVGTNPAGVPLEDLVFLERVDSARATDSSLSLTLGTTLTGDVTFTLDSSAVTGVGDFGADGVLALDSIILDADGIVHRAQVSSVDSATALTLMEPYTGAAAAAGAATKLSAGTTDVEHLINKTVDVIADGEYLGQEIVAPFGVIGAFERPVNVVEIGLPYSWSAATLPQNRDDQGGATTNEMRRVVHIDISMLRATEMRVRLFGDTGDGQRVDFSQAGVTTFGSEPPPFTGTKRVHLLGQNRVGQVEMFGSEPRFTHVRGVTLEVR